MTASLSTPLDTLRSPPSHKADECGSKGVASTPDPTNCNGTTLAQHEDMHACKDLLSTSEQQYRPPPALWIASGAAMELADYDFARARSAAF